MAVSDDYGLELKLNPDYGTNLGQAASTSTWQAGGNVQCKLDYEKLLFIEMHKYMFYAPRTTMKWDYNNNNFLKLLNPLSLVDSNEITPVR